MPTYPLSPQQRVAFKSLGQAGHGRRFRCAVMIEQDLDAGALARAAELLAARHEILRTTFGLGEGGGELAQVVGASPAIDGRTTDWTALDPGQQDSRCAAFLSGAPDPDTSEASGLPLHYCLAKLAPCRHVLLLSMSGLCMDRAGAQNLVRELGDAYAGRPLEAPLQYPDVAEALNEILKDPGAAAGQRYWKDCGNGTGSHVHTGRSPGESEPAFSVQVIERQVPAELRASVRDFAAAHGAPVSTVLFAAWAVLVCRTQSVNGAVIGVACDGRAHAGLERTLGLLTRHVPVAAECGLDGSFGAIVREADRRIRGAVQWQESYGPEAADSWFPYCYEFENRPEWLAAGGVRFSIARQQACFDRFDMKLVGIEQGERLWVELEFNAERFTAAEMRRWTERLTTLLSDAVSRPAQALDELDLAGPVERRELAEWSGARRDYDRARLLPAWFAAQARERPEACAVEMGGARLSYGELYARANRVAQCLRSRGVGAETRVGLCVERSLEMLVGMLGILQAGGAYVALDPGWPSQRLEWVVEDSGMRVALSLKRLGVRLPERGLETLPLDEAEPWRGYAETAPEVTLEPEQLAYVIYTSGSTGRPKGVAVSHANLLHSTQARWSHYREPVKRYLLLSSFAFDSSVAGLFWTLGQGGALHLPVEGAQREPERLVEQIEREGITHLLGLPALYRQVLEAGPGRLGSLRVAIVAGESCPAELLERHEQVAPEAELSNEYGPTEATVWSTVYRHERGRRWERAPIGRAIENAQVYVLDEGLRQCAVGVAGQLYIGGAGVARGYVNRADLTAERFVPNPFGGAGERLYASGDQARWRSEGQLEFLGRRDQQVKVRGYRIELEEIEAAIRRQPGVLEAAAGVRGEPGQERILAWVVSRTAQSAAAQLCAGHPRYRLPNGMSILHQNTVETDYQYAEIFEKQEYLRLGARLPLDACVVDAGANIGMFALFASECCPRGRVYALEPVGETFKRLETNAQLYGANRVRVFPFGLSDQAGEREFVHYARHSMLSGLRAYADPEQDRDVLARYLRRQGEAGGQAEGDAILTEHLKSETTLCRLKRLSDFIRDEAIERIDLLKIDVQRSELDVLRGIVERDWGRIRQIVMEVHDSPRAGMSGGVAAVVRELEAHGYRTVVDQESLLAGADLYQVFAVRPEDEASLALEGRGAGVRLDPVPEQSLFSVEDARRRLSAELPEYMLPAVVLEIAEMPRTPNGKLDRAALPEPEQARGKQRGQAPRTATEEIVAGVWSEVLKRAELVAVNDNFFELGGHSLLATQVVSRLRTAFKTDVTLPMLFEFPTVAELAAQIEQSLSEEQGLAAPPITAAPRAGPLPLSFAQRRLWFLDQLSPGSAAYNVNTSFRFAGKLNMAAFEQALNIVAARHEVLRTRFQVIGGQPAQIIDERVEIAAQELDFQHWPRAARERQLQLIAAAEAERPFNLATGPLIRALVARLDQQESVILLGLHHIAADGWSIAILAKELAIAYEAVNERRPVALAPLSLQYADFACWQQQWLQGPALDTHLNYWRAKLSGAPADLSPPTDHPRSDAGGAEAGVYRFIVPEAVAQPLRSLCHKQGVTLFMLLLAALKALLRYSASQDDIVVGTNVANRNRTETEQMVGFFVNQLVLRTDLSGDPTFIELMGRVRETTLGAYVHQDLPFDALVAELRPERSLAGSPMFRVKLDVETTAGPASGDQAAPVEFKPRPRNDLDIYVQDGGAVLQGVAVYDARLWEAPGMAAIVRQFQQVLAWAAEGPARKLSQLSEALDETRRRDRRDEEVNVHHLEATRLKTARRKPLRAPVSGGTGA